MRRKKKLPQRGAEDAITKNILIIAAQSLKDLLHPAEGGALLAVLDPVQSGLAQPHLPPELREGLCPPLLTEESSKFLVQRFRRHTSERAARYIPDAELPLEVRVPAEEQAEVFFAALRYFLAGGKAKFSRADASYFRAAFARSSLRALVS